MVEFKLYTRMPRQCVPKNVEVFNLPRVLLVESSSQPIDVSFFEAESPTDGTVIGEKVSFSNNWYELAMYLL